MTTTSAKSSMRSNWSRMPSNSSQLQMLMQLLWLRTISKCRLILKYQREPTRKVWPSALRSDWTRMNRIRRRRRSLSTLCSADWITKRRRMYWTASRRASYGSILKICSWSKILTWGAQLATHDSSRCLSADMLANI